MKSFLSFLFVIVAIMAIQASNAAIPLALKNVKDDGLPVGMWKVEFANKVIEECRIANGGECSVDEALRRSNGTATAQGSTIVFTFNDDRVERWTPVGKRYVVEHWYPGSRLPITTPVLGIAEKIE